MTAAFCILFLLVLLCFPELCVRGASDGLALWLFTLVPTFFPFLFLSNFMVFCGAAEDVGRICGRIFGPVFRVTEAGSYILFLGFLSGYPMGAKLTAEYVKTGRISREEGRFLLAFSNNPSPMFLAGFVLSGCMREPFSEIGTLLMFYGAPLLTGLLLSFFRRKEAVPTSYDSHIPETAPTSSGSHFSETAPSRSGSQPIQKSRPPVILCRSTPKTPVMNLIRQSMSDAFATLLILGGYVLLFHIASALILSLAGNFPKDIYPVFCLLAASLEMSGGAAYLAASGMPAGFVNLFVPLCVIFGGFCIMAQTAGLLAGSGLSIRHCVKGKMMQLATAAGIYFIINIF